MHKLLTCLVLVFSAFVLNAAICDHNAGMADSYVLALSSHPGFCQTYGYEAGKRECQHISDQSYEFNHLTLHGLWPNESACGISYGYCNVKQEINFCDYEPLELSDTVSVNLKQEMPSYRVGTCLERHEWYKHGTCQVLSPNDYYALATRLAKEADESGLGQFIAEHKGQLLKLSALRNKISTIFGTQNTNKVYFGCSNGVLVDINFSLPPLIPYNEDLLSLITKAPDYPLADKCPASVRISAFTSLNNAIGY